MRRCAAGSNWNPVQGECICPIGRNGSTCETAALPACRLTERSMAVACTVGRPLHCECLAQCALAGAFSAHLYRYCFTTQGQPPLSELPPPDDTTAQFWHWEPTAGWRGSSALRRVERVEAVQHEYNRGLEHAPHAWCPKRCHERGSCLVTRHSRADSLHEGLIGRSQRQAHESSRCQCDSYYFGSLCARHESPYCWNGCSGRGECVDGFCVCRDGAYGPGCAFHEGSSIDDHTLPHEIMDAHREKKRFASPPALVYVYDLPPLWLRRRTYASDNDPIFNTYHAFMSALLQHTSTSLTATPKRAALFLVPAFATNMENLREYYLHAYRRVATAYPWWNRTDGTDHLWWSTADGGGCELNQVEGVRNSIAVAHYLLTNLSEKEAEAARRRPAHVCGVYTKDVAAPPHLPAVDQAAFLEAGLRPAPQRPISFFFAGNVPDSHLPGFDSRSDDDLGTEAYSEGVRQLVWKHLRKTPGFKVVSSSRTYVDDWLNSRVCLAPMGVGWGIRLLWAVVAGCIPLIASSQVAPWFDRVLPWERMALHGIPKSELRNLPAILAALPNETLREKQGALWRYRKLLLWPSAGGLAHQITLHEVCLRAAERAHERATRWHWNCTSLLPPSALREFPELFPSVRPAQPPGRLQLSRRIASRRRQ